MIGTDTLAGIVVAKVDGGRIARRTYRLGRHAGQTPQTVLDEYFAASIAIAADGGSFAGRGETGEVVISGTLCYEDAP